VYLLLPVEDKLPPWFVFPPLPEYLIEACPLVVRQTVLPVWDREILRTIAVFHPLCNGLLVLCVGVALEGLYAFWEHVEFSGRFDGTLPHMVALGF